MIPRSLAMSILSVISILNVRRLFLFAGCMGIFLGAASVRVLALPNLGDPPDPSIVLDWDPSISADVAGYNVYYGTESGIYSDTINLANVTAADIYDLTPGTTYYFAISSSDSAGNESALSEEISFTYTPPPPPVTLQAQTFNDDNGQPYVMAITATGSGDNWWEMDYSTDLQTWNPYTYGYGSDVTVLVWLAETSEPQMFFRLLSYY